MQFDGGVAVSIVCAIGSFVASVAYISSKMGRIEFQVNELWEARDEMYSMQMRRGASDGATKDIGTMNSPFTVTDESKRWFDSIKDELQAFYTQLNQPQITDLQLFIEIDRCFGTRLLSEIFVPRGLTQAEGLLIAIAVAKNSSVIHLPEDKPSDSGIQRNPDK